MVTASFAEMTRAYFNLSRGDEIIRDGEGIDVSDIKQTVLDVIETLKELQQNESPRRAYWDGWKASIVDDDGTVVSIIPLNTAGQ
jgi:hypothetical protein